MTETLLSVQLIVRNEEALLPFCLDSIQAIADEIIVVDTGSTDNSVAIALSYGAKVMKARWTEDFSHARNIGLSSTQAKWIFCIDADEVVMEGKESLRELLATTDAEAFWVSIDNVLGSLPEERLLTRSVRLFRNKPHYRFRQRLHEQIIPSILEHCSADQIASTPLKLTHLGYYSQIKDQSAKRLRNEKILSLMLNENPQDPFVLYSLGIEKEQCGHTEEALQYLLQAKQAVPAAAAYRPGLIRDIAKVYLELDRPDEAARMLHVECLHYPDYPDLHFLLGYANRLQGLIPEALQSFQKAAGCQSPSHLYPIETGSATFRAYTELGWVMGKTANWEAAKACYEKALEYYAGYMPAILGWTQALYEMKVQDRLIAAGLLQLLSNLPDRDKKFTDALLYLGGYREFLHEYSVGSLPSSPEHDYFAAVAHLHLKQYDQAVSILQRHVSPEQQQRRNDWEQLLALATWSRGSALPFEFYWALSEEERRLYRTLERQFWQRSQEPEDPSLLPLVEPLITLAVQTGMLEVASTLVGTAPSLLLHAAKCLYLNGYVQTAADLFQHLNELGALDTKATHFWAEILFDRGQYGESAVLFEQAVPDGKESARIGASLSYLHAAQSVLQLALERSPRSALLQGELQKTMTSIHLLGNTEWRTVWTPAQRRNVSVVTFDFLMHDRKG